MVNQTGVCGPSSWPLPGRQSRADQTPPPLQFFICLTQIVNSRLDLGLKSTWTFGHG